MREKCPILLTISHRIIPLPPLLLRSVRMLCWALPGRPRRRRSRGPIEASPSLAPRQKPPGAEGTGRATIQANRLRLRRSFRWFLFCLFIFWFKLTLHKTSTKKTQKQKSQDPRQQFVIKGNVILQIRLIF